MAERKTDTAKRKIALGCAVLVLAALVGFGYFAQQVAQEAAWRSSCVSHFEWIYLGLANYHAAVGHLPPAYSERDGRRLHSWRTLFFSQGWVNDSESCRRYRFDEPWDSPHNRQVSRDRPPFYACPSDPGTRNNEFTNYFVVVGDKTAFPGAKSTSFRDNTRGLSNTILIVEAVGMNIGWTEPRDLEYDGMSFVPDATDLPSISSRHPTGPYVRTAKAEPTVGDKTILLAGRSADEIKRMLTIRDDALPSKRGP
jgi:hypothetical protein